VAGFFDSVSGGGTPGVALGFAAPGSEDEAAPPPLAFSARAAANISATEGRFFSSAILVSGAHDEPEIVVYMCNAIQERILELPVQTKYQETRRPTKHSVACRGL
jgi:hypothetical protein